MRHNAFEWTLTPMEASMLVLARKEGETLLIGDSICIKVVEVKGRCVRLGIEAPRDVNVARPERKLPQAVPKDSTNQSA